MVKIWLHHYTFHWKKIVYLDYLLKIKIKIILVLYDKIIIKKKQKSKNNKDDECENCRVRSGLPGTGQKSRHAYEQTVMVEGHIYS